MSDRGGGSSSAGTGAVRLAARIGLWLHAAVWLVFALGMIAIAATSPEPRANPVFLQVMIAASVAAVGSIGAALYRAWGAALALLGGLGVIIAWIAGESGEELRLPAALVLGLFALIVAGERRAFFRPPAR